MPSDTSTHVVNDAKAASVREFTFSQVLIAVGQLRTVRINNRFTKEGIFDASVDLTVDIPFRRDVAAAATELAGRDVISVEMSSPVHTYAQSGFMKSATATNRMDAAGVPDPQLRVVFEMPFGEQTLSLLGLIGGEEPHQNIGIKVSIIQPTLFPDKEGGE